MAEWLSFRYDGSDPEEILKQGSCHILHWYLSRSNAEYEGKMGMDIPRPANARYVMLLWDTTGWSDRNSVAAAVPLDLGVLAPVGDEDSNMYAVFVNDPQAFYSRQTLSDVEGEFDIYAIHLDQEQWAGQFSAEGAPLWGAGMEHDAPAAAGEAPAADGAGAAV